MRLTNIGAAAAIAAALACALTGCSATKESTAPDGWHLVWSDEFDGKAIDRSKWDFQIGTGSQYGLVGWGNNEQQYYTEENAYIEKGNLVLEAKKEDKNGMHYTSARLRTMAQDETPLFSTTYGYIEARIKMPVASGFWPAFWMLPATDAYSTWAASGEIDIMEAKGRLPNRVYGTLHYGQPSPGNRYSGGMYKFPDGGTIGDWHTYQVQWEPGLMRWLVDGVAYYEMTQWWSMAADEAEPYPYPAPYDKPFYILLNFALGGNFDGDAQLDDSALPAKMYVDYVRVYQRDDGYPTTVERPAFAAQTLTMSPAKAEIALSDTVSFSATADGGVPLKPAFSILAEDGISGSSVTAAGTLTPGTLDSGRDTALVTVRAEYKGITGDVPVTIIREKDFAKFFSTESHANGGNNDDEAAFQYPGYMCLWADEGWCGSNVTIEEASASEHRYSLTRTVTGENWFNTQLFYVREAGTYDVSFTVTSTAGGTVTIGQLGADKAVALQAGVPRAISYQVALPRKEQVFSMQLGSETAAAPMLPDGTLTLSDFTVTRH